MLGKIWGKFPFTIEKSEKNLIKFLPMASVIDRYETEFKINRPAISG